MWGRSLSRALTPLLCCCLPCCAAASSGFTSNGTLDAIKPWPTLAPKISFDRAVPAMAVVGDTRSVEALFPVSYLHDSTVRVGLPTCTCQSPLDAPTASFLVGHPTRLCAYEDGSLVSTLLLTFLLERAAAFVGQLRWCRLAWGTIAGCFLGFLCWAGVGWASTRPQRRVFKAFTRVVKASFKPPLWCRKRTVCSQCRWVGGDAGQRLKGPGCSPDAEPSCSE